MAGIFFVFNLKKETIVKNNIQWPAENSQVSENVPVERGEEKNEEDSPFVDLKEIIKLSSEDLEVVLEPRVTLEAPPDIVKAVYLTSASAGSKKKIDYLLNLASTTEINAVVIDIKDYSGYVAYKTSLPAVKKYGAEIARIADIEKLIENLHQEGIYVIARMEVFQDPVFALNRPDLAVHSAAKLASSTDGNFSADTIWLDSLKLAWLDPASKEAWDYNIAIAKDAWSRGFDELNFDYVRFPSDGDLKDIVYPVWDGKTPRNLVIKEFFENLRAELPEAKLSIDFFGLTTVNEGDMGVGQKLEDAFEFFDFVSPMTYPSLYSPGFIGLENPNEHPYEVVKYSMENALTRLQNFLEKFPEKSVKLRPWLQHFNLGVGYNANMLKLEIQASKDALAENYSGYMFWNPSNVYIKEALGAPEPSD